MNDIDHDQINWQFKKQAMVWLEGKTKAEIAEKMLALTEIVTEETLKHNRVKMNNMLAEKIAESFAKF